jgi:hypothetical protein
MKRAIDLWKDSSWESLCWRAGWLVVLVYSLFHLRVIFKSAVDIPYMDEWDFFNEDGIVRGWSKDFIWKFFLDSRIVLTKILYLINYDLFHLNLRYQIFFNVLCYTALAVAFWNLVGRREGGERSFPALLAFLPLVSCLPVESHTRGVIIGKTLCVGFLLGGCYLLFMKQELVFFLLAILFLSLAFLTGSGGVGGVGAVCICFLLWSLWLKDRQVFLKGLFILAIYSLGCLVWLEGFHRSSIHPEFSFPWKIRSLRFMAELISNGFGFSSLNPFIAYLCLYLVLLSLFVTIFFEFKNRSKDPYFAFLMTFTMSLLAIIVLIAFGRAGLPMISAKMSRYTVISVFLPLCLVTLYQRFSPFGSLASGWIILVLAIGLYDQFGFSDYHWIQEERLEGQKCIRELLSRSEANPRGICPTLYPYSIVGRLEMAKQLGVSFTRSSL